jgi:hypothetical protein
MRGAAMARTILRWPTDAERQQIDEIIARHHADRPAGVRRVIAKFGEDHTGDPAVFFEMIVGNELKPTEEVLQALNDYAQILVNDVLQGNPDYFPYVRTVVEE